MIEVLAAIYFGVGLILVIFGPPKHSIAREVEKVKNFKSSSRSDSKVVGKNKIVLFRFIITAGFVVMWPFFLPGVLKDNQKSATIELVRRIKKTFKSEKFNCPKCNKKEAVLILYGYPSPETLQAWHNKEIELGGCIVDREVFNRKCINCNYQWKTK
jgi:hypothetical protein